MADTRGGNTYKVSIEVKAPAGTSVLKGTVVVAGSSIVEATSSLKTYLALTEDTPFTGWYIVGPIPAGSSTIIPVSMAPGDLLNMHAVTRVESKENAVGVYTP